MLRQRSTNGWVAHGFSRGGRESTNHSCQRSTDGWVAHGLLPCHLVTLSPKRWATPAFSLAELMIALVILGLGLLFIAAALPVGLEYTRQTVALETAEAAGESALNQLELNLRTSIRLYDWNIAATTPKRHRLDSIHRPREMIPGVPPNPNRYRLRPTYEPVIKVRPLALGNIGMAQVLGGEPQRGAELVDNAEVAISQYLTSVWGMSLPLNLLRNEFEFPYDNTGIFNDLVSLVQNPVLSGLARVYPPVEPVTTFTVANFFDAINNDGYPKYDARFRNPPLGDLDSLYRERQKAVERRVAWTAFYRRLSYKGSAGPDGVWYSNDDVAEDPLLYELIVVITQRTSLNHRFPRQDLLSVARPFEQPAAVAPTTTIPLVGTDRLAPTPWLVTFDTGTPLPPTPPLIHGTDYIRINQDTANEERVLLNTFNDPPSFTFKCKQQVGYLLPVGSIFIPAINDQRYVPPPMGIPQQVGFVPSAPDALPIYEVVERPDETTVIVKNNGFYPWLNPSSGGLSAASWPVWVIPPAFVERDGSGQPIYERGSSILQIVRRTVTLREITR